MRVALLSLAVLLSIAAPAAATPRAGPVELGTALNSTGFGREDDDYLDAVARYGAVTAESAMKLDALQPSQGRFTFGEADAMVDWSRSRGLAVHGHTLIWCHDDVLPQWLLSRSWTRAELLAVMEDHIATVMKHFDGRVPTWDVVNEAFSSTGARRDCLWQRVIGNDWIELAFRAAREADPDAALFYNETRADIPNSKFEAMEAMAQDFVARGVPLDGIGLQYHLLGHGPLQFLAEDAMRRMGALGLRVHVSEMDGVTSVFGGTREHKLAQQAQAFQTVASACQAVPECFRITMWGVSDQWSWRGIGELSLALDDRYGVKPGWLGIHEEIRTPAPSLQQPPSAPETPSASAPVNAGVFGVSWGPAFDQEGDPLSYALQHRDADDADWTTVATGVRASLSFSFASGRLERQGTYRYRVRAADGRARGAWAEGPAAVVVDRTDPARPAITPDRPAEYAGGGGWHRDSVVLRFAGAGDPPLIDGSAGSGVDPASVPAPRTFSTTGSHSASGVVRDRAGNASAVGSATVRVDAAAPAASLACPAPVDAGEPAAAAWTASDAGAGLAAAATGSLPLDTSAPGTFTARYVATDLVGHATEATCEYVVNAAEEPEPEPEPSPSPDPSPSPSPDPDPDPDPSPSPEASPSAGAGAPPAIAPPPIALGPPRARVAAPARVGADGRVRLTVICAPAPCAGRVALRGDPRSRSAAVRRLRRLGAQAFRTGADGRARVAVGLSRHGRAVLRHRGRLPVRFTVRLAGAGEPSRGVLTLRQK